ncbi:hypothetical protein [Metabacillus sp. Hm71]|uniref:hypothetical protein n=1 Tax=Metabacillus sp. Hm71 TaxID=3450743 RepID=UPI003F44133C
MEKLYWSGCNYHINQGNNEHEPKGTAQSMHDCVDCDRLSYCLVKKDTEIWIHNDVIEDEMKKLWKETLSYKSK